MKLSVITINLNNFRGLEKTIESVISQTSKGFEYIIIDGGSTDGSLEVIKEFSDKISYWTSEPDMGIYNAMNKGIKISKGEYCMFMNSGDVVFDRQVIEKAMDGAKGSDIICGDVLYNTSGLYNERVYSSPHEIKASNLILGYLPHQGSFIRRSLFDDLGLYDESMRYASDWKYFLNALLVHNKSYERIDLLIACCDSSGITSLTENVQAMMEERRTTIMKLLPYYYADFNELNELRQRNNLEVYKYLDQMIKSRFFKLFWSLRLKLRR